VPSPAPAEAERPPAPRDAAPPSLAAPAETAAAPRRDALSATALASAQLNYQQRLLAHLERHKRYPRAAQLRRQQGVPQVRFVIDRQGRVIRAALARASGHALLDEEALALLERAQPLPSLPPEMPEHEMEIIVPIEFFMARR
jgi:protein TonB